MVLFLNINAIIRIPLCITILITYLLFLYYVTALSVVIMMLLLLCTTATSAGDVTVHMYTLVF